MIIHMLTSISYLALTLTTGQAAPIINSSRPRLPVVDLGVTVHRATSNESGGYYIFSNIPYAEPPVGPLRFAQPVPRATVNRTIDDGTNTRICPQANPAWIGISISYVFQVIGARSGQNTGEGNGSIPTPSPYPQLPQSEDCLLLDINVPQTVFKFGAIDKSKKLPVLVWIHGGGFAVGSKNDVNPAGLMAAGRRDGMAGFVYVGINYRLGLFGFPPGPPNNRGIVTNAGLYDQRLALTWVNKNIHRFGGNPGAVTVIGESAGGSGIKAQLSAFGGVQGSTPFRRGIIQSPAMRPASSAALYAQVYKEFLAAAKLPSISAARALPTTQIQALNAAIIGNAPFGHYPFGPNVDGQFIPDEPAKLLTRGLVDKSVDLIVARNSAEGLLFVDPRVQNETGFEAYFQSLMPTVPRTRISQLATVYPEDFSGAQPYKDQTQRLVRAISDSVVDCNVAGLHIAYRNKTRSYQFSVFPGVHVQDVAYTFYNGEPVDKFGLPISKTTAETLQGFFADFAMHGTTGNSSVAGIPVYGSGASVLNIGLDAMRVTKDTSTQRCRYWLTDIFA